MTRDLNALLSEQAASVDFRPPDLGTIRRQGDRRIRGRRSLVALVGVAVAGVVTATVAVFGGTGDPAPVTSPWRGELVWAVGSTIHAGTDTIEVGHFVRAFVSTSAGFVTADDAGDVYSVTAAGVTAIGHLAVTESDQPVLVSDPPGSLAGWTGTDASGTPVLQTYDQATGQFLPPHPAPVADPKDDVWYVAIDGRTAYFSSPLGLYSVDVDTGAEVLLRTRAAEPTYRIHSVENGLLAFAADTGPIESVLVGPSMEEADELVHIPDPPGDRMSDVDVPARLSPTGDWLTVSMVTIEFGPDDSGPVDVTYLAIEPQVFNTSTGAQVPLELPGGPTFAHVSVWLSDTTLQVLVVTGITLPVQESETAEGTLYACSALDGSCQLTADLGSFVLGENATDPPTQPDGYWWQ